MESWINARLSAAYQDYFSFSIKVNHYITDYTIERRKSPTINSFSIISWTTNNLSNLLAMAGKLFLRNKKYYNTNDRNVN